MLPDCDLAQKRYVRFVGNIQKSFCLLDNLQAHVL